MKKYLFILLMLLPMVASAYDAYIDGIYYNLVSNAKSAEVTQGDSKYSGSVDLPNTVTYYGVEYTVTSIGQRAFSFCSSLTSVTIPVSVTSIGDDAFSNCSSLTSVTIPESVTSIGGSAFMGCSSMTSVTIPVSVTSIDDYAFYGCSSLTSVSIPNSVTAIGRLAFYGCSSLTSVTIPESVMYIGSSAFANCSNMNSMTVDVGNENYDSRENCNAIIVTSANNLISGCNNSFIPESVTTIGEDAFFGCSSLTSVSIPNSVTYIGHDAFSGCSSLTSVSIPESVCYIGGSAFANCSNMNSMTVDVGNENYDSRENCNAIIMTSANNLVSGCNNSFIPESVTSISDFAFCGCSSLTSVSIPNSVTYIGHDAFSGCSSLTSVSIPNSVTSIGYGAFLGCSSLTSVSIPESVTSIDEFVFRDCSGLTSVTISESVTSIGNGAFEGCYSLTSVSIPESVTSIDYRAFSGCSSLTSMAIPESVTSISDFAFYGCSSLTSVTIPESVTSIGSCAFYNCTGLRSVTIPSSVVSIEQAAFDGCYNLSEVYCRAVNIPSVDVHPFGYSHHSATLYVPETAINDYQAASPWDEFREILPIIEEYVLVDKEEYTNSHDHCYPSISYTRNFPEETVGTWQAMYLPISINVEDYKEDFDIAEIYAFSPYRDTNGDGVLDGDDDNFMFVSIKKTGCTEPNLPYSIRPKHSGSITINSNDGILHAASDGELVMATTRNVITISGIYREKTLVAGDGNYYVAIDGTLCNTTSSTSIKANRWVMNMKSRDYGDIVLSPNYNVKQIGILAVGEDVDEETAIELIRANSVESTSMANGIYTIDGRNVSNVQKLPAGMYIKNGKKYIVK